MSVSGQARVTNIGPRYAYANSLKELPDGSRAVFIQPSSIVGVGQRAESADYPDLSMIISVGDVVEFEAMRQTGHNAVNWRCVDESVSKVGKPIVHVEGEGKITHINRDGTYGFINRDTGDDVYFGLSNVLPKCDAIDNKFSMGQKVAFVAFESDNGQTKYKAVVVWNPKRVLGEDDKIKLSKIRSSTRQKQRSMKSNGADMNGNSSGWKNVAERQKTNRIGNDKTTDNGKTFNTNPYNLLSVESDESSTGTGDSLVDVQPLSEHLVDGTSYSRKTKTPPNHNQESENALPKYIRGTGEIIYKIDENSALISSESGHIYVHRNNLVPKTNSNTDIPKANTKVEYAAAAVDSIVNKYPYRALAVWLPNYELTQSERLWLETMKLNFENVDDAEVRMEQNGNECEVRTEKVEERWPDSAGSSSRASSRTRIHHDNENAVNTMVVNLPQNNVPVKKKVAASHNPLPPNSPLAQPAAEDHYKLAEGLLDDADDYFKSGIELCRILSTMQGREFNKCEVCKRFN